MINQKYFPNLLTKSRLKSVSVAVLGAELLDIATTFLGLLMFPQVTEANPLASFFGGMMGTVLFKIAVVLFVILILEKVEKWPRVVWVVPITAALAVVWNLVIILAELIVPVLAL